MKNGNLDDELVDYLRMRTARVKMTNYLRTSNFKKIAGAPIISKNVAKRRVGLIMTAIIILLIGCFYVIV